MKTLKLKSVAVSLIVGLTLALPLSAQMGQMKSMPGKDGMGMMKAGGMMGQMKMSGPVTMNGKPYNMQCDMAPVGKSKGMMGHGTMSMKNKQGMSDMKMTKPMKMTGTMTMMGQSYHCTMMMTPQGK